MNLDVAIWVTGSRMFVNDVFQLFRHDTMNPALVVGGTVSWVFVEPKGGIWRIFFGCSVVRRVSDAQKGEKLFSQTCFFCEYYSRTVGQSMW